MNRLKITLLVLLSVVCIMVISCGKDISIGIIGGADGPTQIIISNNANEDEDDVTYTQITADEAKKIMDSDVEYIILDTREQYEYDQAHIPGAILLPYTEIENKAEEMLTDKEALILVYCRSGRRSKIASESLAELGYTNVKEFGGIIDWPYEVEKPTAEQ